MSLTSPSEFVKLRCDSSFIRSHQSHGPRNRDVNKPDLCFNCQAKCKWRQDEAALWCGGCSPNERLQRPDGRSSCGGDSSRSPAEGRGRGSAAGEASGFVYIHQTAGAFWIFMPDASRQHDYQKNEFKQQKNRKKRLFKSPGLRSSIPVAVMSLVLVHAHDRGSRPRSA